MQRCPSFEHVLTEVEWAAIKQPTATRAGRTGAVALRAWLIGIERPAELTLKRMVAILAYVSGDVGLSQELARMFCTG